VAAPATSGSSTGGGRACARNPGFHRDPEQQQARPAQWHADQPDQGAPPSGHRQPFADGIGQQPGIESDDHRRVVMPGLSPRTVAKRAHAGRVAGEMDERNDGERQLHAEHGLAEQQQAERGFVAGEVDGEGGRCDGQRA